MKNQFFLVVIIFFCFSCKEYKNVDNITVTSVSSTDTISEYDVIVGAERVSLYHPFLENKKVACVVNHASTVGKSHLVDTLLSLDVDIVKLFSPEHGFRGEADAGEKVNDGVDSKTGIPIVSLYGSHKKPSDEDLKDVDVVIFDLQDVGVRFYTYISTLSYMMEACAKNDIEVIVLDRPNPHLDYIDGPVLKNDYKSFVGLHNVPVIYGMTIGEYATMVNEEGWLEKSDACNLKVIPCKNLKRDSYYKIPLAPSPNLPNMKSIYLYPSLCFFEPTAVSVGRGTSLQFQQIGHPDYMVKSYVFTPSPNKGAKNPKHNGIDCFGDNLSTLTLGALQDLNKLDLTYLVNYYRDYKDKEHFFSNAAFFDKLAGTDQLREQLVKGISEENIRASWQSDLTTFNEIRKRYLRY